MDKPIRTPFALLLLTLAGSAPAFTAQQCVDQDGSVTFRDSCPPGTERVASKQLRGDRKVETVDVAKIAARNPVVLYSAPACADVCDLVRNQLQNRNVPFSEVDVTSAIAKELPDGIVGTNGTVTVPTVTVAEQHITGYNRSELDNALNGVGYPEAVVGD